MMILPFASLTLALWLALRGFRVASMWTWAAALALTLVLFRLHATDALRLGW